MTLDGNGNFDVAKTNLYRAEVGQPPVSGPTTGPTARRCTARTWSTSRPRSSRPTRRCSHRPTPVPGTGDNLFTFMANRLNMSFTNLDCQNFGLTNPVTVTLDGNGAAVAATFNTTVQAATNGSGHKPPSHGSRKGRKHHQLMNPSGA